MDGIKSNPVAYQTVPAARSRQAPTLPKPSSSPAPVKPEPKVEFDLKAAEQKRFEAVQQASRAIANTYVVSDSTFSLFKDATGQYITRFTSLRDGKVTYIPEPELLSLGGSGAQALNIKV